MGKCNLNPLYLIRRDTDLSSIDWCDYIVDCLVRTKKVYNPEKESSFFYGPATYLMGGGFGCGHVNEAYVEEEFQESEYNEEESGGDEVESDGEEDLCDEDEEDFDVNKVSDVEKMEDLKKDIVVKIDEGVLKFPQSQNLKNWKLLFPVEDLITESFDFNYVSQKYKEPILTPGFVQVNDEDYGNDFLNDDENVEDYDQGKCSGGQGDGSDPHEGNIGKNHVEGKGDDDEDDEQGNGSGCNKEEAKNLNSVVENVTKSVGLIDSQEGVSFSQFICDLVVESFLKTLDQGTDGCLNEKLVEDDVNLNLTGIDDGSKKSSQSQISSERMTKKKIKDRVILGKPSAGPECVILNVDVIDASPVSFAPPLGILYCLWKQMLLVLELIMKVFLKKTHLHVSVLDSWSRILNHQEKFIDVVNSPLRLFMNSDTTLSFEYTHLNETAKYKVFKDNFSCSVSGDRDLKVLKDVDMKRAFEVIDNGADDADFDDKYGAVFKPLKKSFLKYLKEIDHVKANEMADKNLTPICSKDLLCSMEIIFLSNGEKSSWSQLQSV
ncbi:unnamed protein product [Lactuca virosa]|uniref:Condensin complex subunit 2 n=1 Tax=Lactuca virosa TaxID=75947 RepID=A0AAU9P371_9ASTR|nr:unnamed protein product [Lactuca virosa]